MENPSQCSFDIELINAIEVYFTENTQEPLKLTKEKGHLQEEREAKLKIYYEIREIIYCRDIPLAK